MTHAMKHTTRNSGGSDRATDSDNICEMKTIADKTNMKMPLFMQKTHNSEYMAVRGKYIRM